MTDKQIKICACMGPMYDEPYCHCKMVDMNLPLNEEARAKDAARLKEALANMFKWEEPDEN